MLVKIKEAFDVYKKEMIDSMQMLMQKSEIKPCSKCMENIKLMQTHEAFDLKNPTVLSVDCDSNFRIHDEHLTRISEHMGMPIITSHDYCEACSTNFYYEFEGFDSDHVFRFEVAKLETIEDYLPLFHREKILYLQRFAPFLNEYFKENKEEITIYVSLDENLKRKNHDYLVSYYKKEGKSLEGLDEVHAYLSEDEIFTSSRMGALYEKEFLQKVTYPLNKIFFDFSTYFDAIQTNIDIKHIKNQTFFDVYKKEFVPFDILDLANIHMIKRNADSYEFFGEMKAKLGVDRNNDIDHFEVLFDQFFEELTKEMLTVQFGESYTEYLAKEEEKSKRHKDFMQGLKEWGAEMRKKENREPEKVQKSLNGIETYDNVVVQEGIYKNMKGCVKSIDFQKEKLGIVFFGETDFDNVLYIDAKKCLKV